RPCRSTSCPVRTGAARAPRSSEQARGGCASTIRRCGGWTRTYCTTTRVRLRRSRTPATAWRVTCTPVSCRMTDAARMIEIVTHRIGAGHRPFVVAEMSGNHNRSLERALAIVDAAADAGAHALKIQTY